MKSSKPGNKQSLFWDLKKFFSVEGEKSNEEIVRNLSFHDVLATDKEISEEEIAGEYHKLERTIQQPGPVFKVSFQNMYKYAAAFIGFILISGILLIVFNHTSSEKIATAYGEIKEVKLPDGSIVVLNAHSRLTYSDNWSKSDQREVTLEGEAYFKVRKINSSKGKVKFVVRTKDLNVEVVGTEFNVTTRRKYTRIVLESGKVKVKFSDHNISMNPGELVEFQTEGRNIVHRKVNPEIYSSWIKNEWTMENISLAEIGKRIEDIYGFEVKISNDSLANVKLTGRFPTTDLNKLLKMLSASTNIKIQKTNHVIVMN